MEIRRFASYFRQNHVRSRFYCTGKSFFRFLWKKNDQSCEIVGNLVQKINSLTILQNQQTQSVITEKNHDFANDK